MKNKCFKFILALMPLLLLTLTVWANEPDEVAKISEPGIMEWVLHNVVLLVGAVVILAAFGTLLYFNNMLLQIQKIRLLQEHGTEIMKELKLMPRVSWWVALLYVITIFAVIYVGYYHVFGYGLNSAEKYEVAMEEAEEANLSKQEDLLDETNLKLLIDESALSLGESIFKEKCSPCHGQLGEGNSIGPNLTDEYWLNGGGIKNVFKTIKYGVPEKGMISWKMQLQTSDIHQVASYILSLQGTDPPNAKEQQGEIWKVEMEQDSFTVIGMK